MHAMFTADLSTVSNVCMKYRETLTLTELCFAGLVILIYKFNLGGNLFAKLTFVLLI